MKVPLTLPLILAAHAYAHKFSLKRISQQTQPLHRRSPQNNAGGAQVVTSDPGSELSLSTIHDLIYLTNITVGGHEYSVQLDTGSSDLWLKGDVQPLPGTAPTTTVYNISYVLGWAAGHLSFAPVEFAELKVPKQAFIDVTEAVNPVLGYGLNGIVGLGFTSLSGIDHAVNESSSDAGRSLLYNLFAVNPSEPNFLAFALERSTEADDEVEGSFSIGEIEPKYAAVTNSTPISTWPVRSPKRWTVLLDSVIVNGTITVPTTAVVGAPSNKAVVLMDSGASYTYAPRAITDAVYGNITGARFDEKSGQWIVPCDLEVNMALQIGGQVFPLHPLDVTPAAAGNNSTCLGSIIPTQLGAQTQFDWLVGDNFLRSVYAVYDFGDYDDKGQMGDPYMKMLSIVDPDEASVDFHNVRGGTPQKNITYVGLDGTANAPSFFLSNDISESVDMIRRFIPVVLAIVALNAVVLIVALVGGLVCWMRRRRTRANRIRTPRGRLSPMPLNNIPSYIAGPPPQPSPTAHAYQPVSMAMTEDTFIPPAPAFHKFESTLQPGDRPKSIA